MIADNSDSRAGAVAPRSSAEVSADLAKLLQLLRTDGILRSGPGQPISGRDGIQVPWMFYSWNCSLTGRGAALAGRCLVNRLHSFRATQLATYGYTGIPLLSACIHSAGDKYTGMVIREVRKRYGSSRQIEGPADRGRPVVLIDDSLSSGTSLRKGIQSLEEEGFQVEGALVLVNFPFRGGLEWAGALGYRVEALFDAWKDLGAPRPSFVPGHKRFPAELWSREPLADGLHPAIAARRAAEFYLRRGLMPMPASRFDRQYDGRGGVYVSFRERHNDNRIARDGYWHFNPADADPYRDVVLATVKAVQSSSGKINLQSLANLKIGVSFFSPLEKITPAKLDFARYGIVARSKGWGTKLGGALPNTQVYTSEIEQYTHARWRNARIPPSEPHDLFRHEITKCVEPGEYWLPYGTYQDPGTHWSFDESIGRRLTDRVMAALKAAAAGAEVGGDSVPDGLIPDPVYGVAVTLYHGSVEGCYVTWSGTLDACLIRAANKALKDTRFAERHEDTCVEDLEVVVSILHDREWLGQITLERAAMKLRLGTNSMSVQQGSRRGILLSTVAPHFDWTKEKFAKELLRKAGISDPPYTWGIYQTATWLRTANATHKIASGYPERRVALESEERFLSYIADLAGYIFRSLGPDGLPEYFYSPVTGQRLREGSPARIVHALGALEEAGRFLPMPSWNEAARRGLDHCLSLVHGVKEKASLHLGQQQPSAMSDLQLLLAAANSIPESTAPSVAALALRVKAMFQPDGRVTDTPHGLGVASEHDFLPGVALLAMAKFAERHPSGGWTANLSAQLIWYRRRFRLVHPWGMVGWQTQGWAAVHKLTGDVEQARFVFEIADWALEWQQERTGAFITDLSPTGPSFHSAFLAEGIAAAWELATRIGDRERAARYERSCREALRFVTRLIVHPEDTFCMRHPARALGGVRESLTTSRIRIDFVSHTLCAFMATLRLIRQGNR